MEWSRSAGWWTVATVAVCAVVLSGCPKKPQIAVQTAGVQGAGSESSSQPVEDVAPPAAVEERPIAASPAQPTAGLSDVYFEFDQSDVTAAGRTVLEQNAKWLLSRGSAQVKIEGHADERGTNEYNVALSERRAQAVKRMLIALGVPAANLSTIGHGEEQPACREHGESCWQKNRRAHLAVR
ncbi:MAG: peptidoglycan-associated lipoprotein Pal [Nitrospirota bacterium]